MAIRGIFVIVTLPSCGHCQDYLFNQHDKLLNLLRSDGRIKLLHLIAEGYENTKRLVIAEETANEKGLTLPHDSSFKLPAELYTTYWKWWPNFMLFTKESWESCSNGQKTCRLQGSTLGGKVINKIDEYGKAIQIIEENPREYNAQAEKIMEWIINQLNSSLFESQRRIRYKNSDNEYNDIKYRFKTKYSPYY
jgi:hypothetical protein